MYDGLQSPGRNDECWCGSGKKYKKCHLDFDERLEELAETGEEVPPRDLLKTPAEIEGIKRSAEVNVVVLDYLAERITPGITTEQIDQWVHDYTVEHGAIPAPLDYEGFPKSVCTSVNEVVCHGIPSPDEVLREGDIVNIDFVGTVDGVKFDGGEAEGFDLTLGSGQFIPGFEDQVVGMNIGDKKDVNVKFPENYQAESLKGKDAVFAVKLNSIKGKELPELTDAFIKDATGSETIEEYKQKTRERLQKQADKNALDATENSILEAISATAEAEIPQAMIEREIDGLVQKFEYQLMYQGLKLQDYLDFIKVSKEDFRKNYEEQAKKNVLNQLIISQIIKDEKIEATAEEVDAKVAEQAASVDKSAEEYKKSMDPRQFDYIKSDIIITKLFDFLKANNEMYREENKE